MLKKGRSLLVTFVFGVLMILAYFIDLPLSKAIYHIKSPFGRFFEAFGEMPAVIVAVLSFGIILYTISSTGIMGWIYRGTSFVFLALFSFLSIVMPLHYLLEDIPVFIVLLGSIMVFCFVLFISKKVTRLPRKRQIKFRRVANLGISLFLASVVLINIVKLIWGRVRFREMSEPFDMFTAWFVPQFGNFQGVFEDPASFPSGHTANAAVLIIIVLLPYLFEKLKGKELALLIIALSWTGLVAVSRIIMGAHFVSDVTVGAFIVFYSFIFLKKLFNIKGLNQQGGF